jgi:hypothetical protein
MTAGILLLGSVYFKRTERAVADII